MHKILTNQFHVYRIPQDSECEGSEGCRDCESCTHKKKQKGLSTEEADRILRNAALSAAQILISEVERNTTMDDILLPAGIIEETGDEEKELLALQEQADNADMLLPAQFNKGRKSEKQQQQGTENDLLLPPGMN